MTSDTRPIHIVALCGSLRKDSYNRMAAQAAVALAPAGMRIAIADIRAVPFYDDDVRAAAEPAAVAGLKEEIRQADGVLISSPEYNFSVPGVLKNTLDWLSRPPAPPFDGKPVAIMGASMGVLGTSRMQYHLRQVLVYMNTSTLNKPEIFIPLAQHKFGKNGELSDGPTQDILRQFLLAFGDHVRQVQAGAGWKNRAAAP